MAILFIGQLVYNIKFNPAHLTGGKEIFRTGISGVIIILEFLILIILIRFYYVNKKPGRDDVSEQNSIIEKLPTALIIAYAKDFRIKFCNQKAQELLDLIPGESYNLKDLLNLPDIKISEPSILYEDRLVLGNRKKINVSIGIYTVHIHNDDYFIVSVTDITSHKINLDELNEARMIAESANRLKTEFIANMSHEMRTPMNAIIGISQMLMRYNKENLTSKQYEGLSMIYQSADRLLALINDILDLSKIEAGKMEIEHSSISFEKLSTQLRSLVYTLIDKKPIKFSIKKSSNVPEVFIADYNKLLQVLINLLSNSVKFTEEGKINLNVHCVSEKLYFEVTDTGMGIPKKDIDKIFDRFHRVKSEEARKQRGTGLGLALCKDYVNLMNGNILAFSEVNKGTTISFFIPLITGEEREVASDEVTAVEQENNLAGIKEENIKIVLIEPDKSLNSLFHQYLSIKDYSVIRVYDGVEGYQAIVEEKPDIVITELKLARWSGYDLLKRLSNTEGLALIPVILVTSVNKKPDKKTYNYYDYLQKPVSESKLLDTIKSCLLTINAKRKKRSKVFIVDDEDSNIFTLESILEDTYEVFEARGGEEALNMMEKISPDVLLLDIMMPDKDGFEVVAEIRKNKNLEALKIVAVTASAMKEDKEKILSSGFDYYLSKPVDPDIVLKLLDEILNE
jgi:signal transduction histidine kinase/DNA-binding response OmpR family regulator